ncbi:MAG: hypothetical protein OXU44_00490 [Gammaproteobacteria bacterium]|nr:hypothetical protein [Gammaproteobacteria bacterium]
MKTKVLKALLAKSGNVCAFPECQQELVTKKNLFVGQLCHIEAVSPGGPRYNPASKDDQRNEFENLMFLCYPHHREVDADEGAYPVSRLRKIKSEHEALYEGHEFRVSAKVISQIERESRRFWLELVKIQDSWLQQDNIISELAVKIDVGNSPIKLFQDIQDMVQHIQTHTDILREDDHNLNEEVRTYVASLGYSLNRYDDASVSENPFIHRGWETHNLILQNSFVELSLLLLQAEVRYLEEYLKTHSGDAMAQKRFKAVKQKLEECALAARAD